MPPASLETMPAVPSNAPPQASSKAVSPASSSLRDILTASLKAKPPENIDQSRPDLAKMHPEQQEYPDDVDINDSESTLQPQSYATPPASSKDVPPAPSHSESIRMSSDGECARTDVELSGERIRKTNIIALNARTEKHTVGTGAPGASELDQLKNEVIRASILPLQMVSSYYYEDELRDGIG
jgi:hypothetical protein